MLPDDETYFLLKCFEVVIIRKNSSCYPQNKNHFLTSAIDFITLACKARMVNTILAGDPHASIVILGTLSFSSKNFLSTASQGFWHSCSLLALLKLTNIGTEQAPSAGQQEQQREQKTMRGFNYPSFILL